MTTQPEVLSVRRHGSAVKLDLHVPAELAYFPSHFPRFAMLPGVVQIDWAIALAREHLTLNGEFRKLLALKFQQPILPGARVTLSLDSIAQSEIVFAYVNTTSGAARACSGGRIIFQNLAEPAND